MNDKLNVTQRLTVSYGLRYEVPVPIYAVNNICCAIYQAATDTLAIPGIAPGVAKHYAPAPKHDFAPRLSLTMQIHPTLVVRAGYGLYYNSGASQISNLLSGAFYGGVPGGFVGNEIDNSTPQTASLSQVFQPSPQVALGTFPVSTGPGQGYYGDGASQTVFYADQKSFRTPYIHRYLLDIQQQVGHNSAITLSYIGAEGRNGWYFVNANAAPYQTGWPDSNTHDAARPHNSGRFGDIYLQRSGLTSNYNAGIVKFQHQMSHGLQILTHYTYSKILGDRGSPDKARKTLAITIHKASLGRTAKRLSPTGIASCSRPLINLSMNSTCRHTYGRLSAIGSSRQSRPWNPAMP